MPARDKHPLHSRKQQTNRKQACVHCEEVICRSPIQLSIEMSDLAWLRCHMDSR
jgi:hypothetical protein